MALNQINKLVWIVETINNSVGGITFEELNSRWKANQDLSNGADMLKRTFQKWKLKIADTFGLDIECNRNESPCRYYIRNADDLRRDNNRVEKWLLNTYSVANSLSESKSIKDRILIDEIPSGREMICCAQRLVNGYDKRSTAAFLELLCEQADIERICFES